VSRPARIDEIGGWQVAVWVMDFVREGPCRHSCASAWALPCEGSMGRQADERDREVWFVTGTPSGKDLTRAAARVVDELADETRASMRDL
jgi:hypothetical protein